MSRILVTGKYESETKYILSKENGDVFQIIKENEPFVIGNQNRVFVPVRVNKKKGKGTILMCRKYNDNGKVIEEFPLINNKKGLWATTSGSARNGVFHKFHEPQNKLEKFLSEIGVSGKIVEKTKLINNDFKVGGQLCGHCTKNWGYEIITDGKREDLTTPPYAPNDHSNIYHRGCIVGAYTQKVYDATYVIYYEVNTRMNGTRYKTLRKILITEKANEDNVINALREVY